MATDFEKVLMNRDGVTKSEAAKSKQEARQAVYDMLEDGCGYDEIEEMLADDYGLEMDYIMDLV